MSVEPAIVPSDSRLLPFPTLHTVYKSTVVECHTRSSICFGHKLLRKLFRQACDFAAVLLSSAALLALRLTNLTLTTVRALPHAASHCSTLQIGGPCRNQASLTSVYLAAANQQIQYFRLLCPKLSLAPLLASTPIPPANNFVYLPLPSSALCLSNLGPDRQHETYEDHGCWQPFASFCCFYTQPLTIRCHANR